MITKELNKDLDKNVQVASLNYTLQTQKNTKFGIKS